MPNDSRSAVVTAFTVRHDVFAEPWFVTATRPPYSTSYQVTCHARAALQCPRVGDNMAGFAIVVSLRADELPQSVCATARSNRARTANRRCSTRGASLRGLRHRADLTAAHPSRSRSPCAALLVNALARDLVGVRAVQPLRQTWMRSMPCHGASTSVTALEKGGRYHRRRSRREGFSTGRRVDASISVLRRSLKGRALPTARDRRNRADHASTTGHLESGRHEHSGSPRMSKVSASRDL